MKYLACLCFLFLCSPLFAQEDPDAEAVLPEGGIEYSLDEQTLLKLIIQENQFHLYRANQEKVLEEPEFISASILIKDVNNKAKKHVLKLSPNEDNSCVTHIRKFFPPYKYKVILSVQTLEMDQTKHFPVKLYRQ